MRSMLKILTAVCCLLLGVSVAMAADLKGWGVLVIHGKGKDTSHVASVAAAMKSAGAEVVMPIFSWASSYLTYGETLDEIAGHVAELRTQGAQRIALVGHSLGANVALGYAAQRGGVQAVIAMAPAHQPDVFIDRTGPSLARAKAAIKAGHGDQVDTYTDVNQGAVSQIRTSAAAYASFFDPSGPAVISRNAGAGGAPLLWVVGTGDPGARRAAKGGTTITVTADHFKTPAAGAAQAVSWLEGR